MCGLLSTKQWTATVIHTNLVHFTWLLQIMLNIALSYLNLSGSPDRCDECHSDQDAGLLPYCPASQCWGIPSLLCPTVAPRGHFGNWCLLELPSVYMHQLLTIEVQNTTRYSNKPASLRPPALVKTSQSEGKHTAPEMLHRRQSAASKGEKVTVQSNASAKLFFQKTSVCHIKQRDILRVLFQIATDCEKIPGREIILALMMQLCFSKGPSTQASFQERYPAHQSTLHAISPRNKSSSRASKAPQH